MENETIQNLVINIYELRGARHHDFTSLKEVDCYLVQNGVPHS